MGKKVKKEVVPPAKDVFDPLAIESKKAETAVLMLQSAEQEILTKACDALYKFAQKGVENKVKLLGFGAVESLSKLISHEDKTVRRNSVMVCGIMAAHNDVRKLMRKLDIIPSLIARLVPEEEVVVHEFSTLCLAHMATDYCSKARIFELNGLGHLIRLLGSPDPDVKKNSVECIYLLAQDFQSRSAVCENDAVPPLLELLKSDYPVIQQLSLKALGSISCEADCRLALKENQAMDHLIKILEAKELNDLHVEALLIIANCLEDADTVQLLQQSGGLKKILTFAETSPLADIQRNAAKAIAKSAHNAENRKFFHEQEAEKTLLNLLSTDNDGVKTASLQAISAMCASEASKDLFGEHGIPQIIHLLNKDSAELREAAAFTMANLTTGSPSNASKAAEADGPATFIHLLSDKRDGVVTNACMVLINMAAQESLRPILQAQGVMNALVEPLQSSSNLVQSKAVLTVAAVGCDAEARAEFRNAGGLTHLVKLLSSNYDDVRRNAYWAVAVCANEELTAAELYRLGAYDVLQEINLSASRRNNFSELALNKMLDNNLSLKYNQKGFLSYTNLINDGFYDHGRIKPDAKLPSLEELSKQELNQSRAVILINTKLPELATPSPLPVEEKTEPNIRQSPSSQSRSASKEKGGRGQSPVEDKQEHSSGRSPSVSRSRTKEKSSSKGKGKAKKEEEKVKEEDEVSRVIAQPDPTPETLHWFPPCDKELNDYISEASTTILPLPHLREQVVALAQFVAERMGGAIEREGVHEFSWELHISELKFELNSNVVPIGKIKKGIFYHRALLYKAVADRIGIACTLERGDYGRAWNEVKLFSDSLRPGTKALPESYIVDLMHEPGRLIKHGTAQAESYQQI
ncbi:PREDICTED: armadillo repeat-containing protein 3 [Nanorana parkeri]|uniref:armadillo repeat-containing protein 3 n=1 Tax=Nanorana parkeri TaxID=125878 RepID=UPI000854E3C7|nr:PREDICTED: armadillo repeat-containing protein 3 [Nanorana parkeri]